MNFKGFERIKETSKYGPSILQNEMGCSVIWEPGDGTRYVFLFTDINGLMVNDGVGADSVLCTKFYCQGDGAASMTHDPNCILAYEYAREKMPALRDQSGLYAFVIITNWLYGNLEYGDEMYDGMAEHYDFKNLLLKVK